MIRRSGGAVRPDWERIVESQGLGFHRAVHPGHLSRPYWDESVHYEFEMEEVLRLEAVVEELHRMCLEAVDHVVAEDRFAELGIPDWVAPSIRASWQRRDPHLYGRFDLVYDGSAPPKMLEYNADTPTCLVESAIIQWHWMRDRFPDGDQWNSLHERLVDRWAELGPRLPSGTLHFAWTNEDETGEEALTTAYLQETAEQAGLPTVEIALEDIGWDYAAREFVDLEERAITAVFKLYPWEWLVKDRFGPLILQHLQTLPWIEPVWKMVLSNKAILAILWEMYPDHPNLLPAYLGDPGPLESYVAKPLLGREGASMRIVTPHGELVRTPGDYGAEGYVFQDFHPLPEHDGQHPTLGTWVVGDEAAGLGIRETTGLITDDTSSFVPHVIRV
ncbi:glutathionylspermidine synthase family protein [Marinactinospora thermotolerans]|uniref:Glutathionylspermidine synthase preATP-grasp n=1 Tax=Marinactinospora thermotolerans DSM 45154 TaxID=1122192 RepID=A0A1T4SUL8_9ACTN|nr:glutathionylspermidine synthase family protein [Marinactinospora thermotolerans]SKA31954.1 Glutathionylspermidine synthase preATP-grasp [Marinactinospora thermotolerans DSM 45154]